MRNLLNCHSKGLHSFPISFKDGLYRRIFFAAKNHNLWKPIELAIHPHHVDIKITVLEGELYNPLYVLDDSGDALKQYQWNSHILNGNGGFEYMGEARFKQFSNHKYGPGESTVMNACELHTVQIEKGKQCVWLIEEEVPTCEYFPMNYSPNDLSDWTTDGLYIQVSDWVKHKYIGRFLDAVQA